MGSHPFYKFKNKFLNGYFHPSALRIDENISKCKNLTSPSFFVVD